MHKIPNPQELQSLNIKDYNIRIIVAGSRGFNDKRLFHEVIMEYLDGIAEPVLFISGKAASGADDLIIQWCKKFKYPCIAKPADWENEGKIAGFIRNREMAKIGNKLIAFWDNKSPGTRNMIGIAHKFNIATKIILISD